VNISIFQSVLSRFSQVSQAKPPVQPKPVIESGWRIHDQPFNGQWYIFPACGGRVIVTVEGERETAEHIVDLHNRSLSIL
jgi:hypothetical protein